MKKNCTVFIFLRVLLSGFFILYLCSGQKCALECVSLPRGEWWSEVFGELENHHDGAPFCGAGFASTIIIVFCTAVKGLQMQLETHWLHRLWKIINTTVCLVAGQGHVGAKRPKPLLGLCRLHLCRYVQNLFRHMPDSSPLSLEEDRPTSHLSCLDFF